MTLRISHSWIRTTNLTAHCPYCGQTNIYNSECKKGDNVKCPLCGRPFTLGRESEVLSDEINALNTLNEIEDKAITIALAKHNGSLKAAAKQLGISYRNIKRKVDARIKKNV